MKIRDCEMIKAVAQIFLVAALTAVMGATYAISGTPTSHLQPEEGIFGFKMLDPYFEAVSDRLLSASRYRNCQAVFMPSFSQESAVFLERDNDRAVSVVVAKQMERQLWAEMNAFIKARSGVIGDHRTWADDQRTALHQIESVIVTRKAQIDEKTADVLESVWSGMLARVKYPEKANLGLDGETVHFANFIPKFGYQTGKVWSPHKGTPSYEFVELAKALRDYPDVNEKNRSVAAQSLRQKAKALLSRLKGKT